MKNKAVIHLIHLIKCKWLSQSLSLTISVEHHTLKRLLSPGPQNSTSCLSLSPVFFLFFFFKIQTSFLFFSYFLLKYSCFTKLCYSTVQQSESTICLQIPQHWAEFPVLHSRFLLVIYFIHSFVCMSIPIKSDIFFFLMWAIFKV